MENDIVLARIHFPFFKYYLETYTQKHRIEKALAYLQYYSVKIKPWDWWDNQFQSIYKRYSAHFCNGFQLTNIKRNSNYSNIEINIEYIWND